ncbi:hypothetical protein [Phaeovulum sp.]|uniref:hypothetical protein n=1 Tax=Phaeovulum sp. TaxID=2934796 RepID=UPI0039E64141
MEMIANSCRGLSVFVDLMADRILVPLAIAAALVGACIIGLEVAQMLSAPPAEQNRL